MANGREFDKPAVYEIRVRGKLDERWSRWFADLKVIPQPDGCSLFTGPIADQAHCMACSAGCATWGWC